MKFTNASRFLFLIASSFFACEQKTRVENRVDVIFSFIEFIKYRKYDSASSMICYNDYSSNSNNIINHDIKRTTDILLKYKIPEQNKWEKEFDTLGDVVKLVTYKIPIFLENISEREYEEAYMKISFDYTRNFIGDSIFHYQLFTRKIHKPGFIFGQ